MTLDRAGRAALAERMRATPHAFVAQEWVRLSQAPTWSNETQQFEPRVVGLRLYATANGDGYDVMPGGLARVAPESASRSHHHATRRIEQRCLGAGRRRGAVAIAAGAAPRRPQYRPRRILFAVARGGKSVLDGALRRAHRKYRHAYCAPSRQRLTESDPAHLPTLKVLTAVIR